MPVRTEEGLIDRIYEAAVVPEFWPAVLDDIAAVGGGAGTILLTQGHGRVGSWTASEATVPFFTEWATGGWAARSERASRMLAKRHPGWVSDLDLYTPEEMDRDPGYAEFLRPRGFGWGAATFVQVPSGDAVIVSLERRLAAGPVSPPEIAALDRLRPHLARAGLVAARMELKVAESTTNALATIGLPAAVVAQGGRVLAANDRLSQLSGQISSAAHGRLHVDARAQPLFKAALDQVTLSSTVRSIPLRAVRHPA